MAVRRRAPVRAAWALAALLLPPAAGAARAEVFGFVALGDMPYTLPDDYPRFERLIGVVDGLEPAFTVHVGDTKSGGSPCSDEVLGKARDLLNSFEGPLVYTPGDNEWTDCHRKAAGGMDPLERLAKVRELHFAEAKSLGRRPMPVERQADLMPEHRTFVENLRWSQDKVQFTTVHVVGSNNGFERNPASVAEYFARDAANVAWIEAGFKKAADDNAVAAVFAFQANPFWSKKPADRGGEDGFKNTLAALAKGAEAFGRPVLLIQGDDHVLVIDQPLLGSDGKVPLENVTRLQVMGANLVHAVHVTVDTETAGVFGFTPVVVRDNLQQAAAAAKGG